MQSKQGGFTFIEVVCALAIIGLLSSLALVAVGRIRERSRSVQCVSHLREYGIGINKHVIQHRELPGGRTEQRRHGQTDGPHRDTIRSMGILLPSSQRMSSAELTTEFSQKQLTGLAVFFSCPSDTQDLGISYRFCTGVSPNPFANSFPPPGTDRRSLPRNLKGVGAFPIFEGLPPSAVLDGFSNTVAMSERVIGSPDNTETWIYRDFVGDDLDASPDEYREFACGSEQRHSPYQFSGKLFNTGGSTLHVHYNHVDYPNSACKDTGNTTFVDYAAVAARSYHSGFVNVLFLDGSVRQMSDSVDLELWRSAASINDSAVFDDN